MSYKSIFLSFFVIFAVITLSECSKDEDPEEPTASCTDGIQNQDETGVDCGGSCPPCVYNTMTANIDGTPWSAGSLQFQYVPGNFWFQGIAAGFPAAKIKVVHKGAYAPGVYNLDADSEYIDENDIIYTCTSGTVEFTLFEQTHKIIAGTFSLTASDGTTTVTITDGVFQNLQYQVTK